MRVRARRSKSFLLAGVAGRGRVHVAVQTFRVHRADVRHSAEDCADEHGGCQDRRMMIRKVGLCLKATKF